MNSHSLNYSRPHLVELIGSDGIVVSNLTFLNTPSWNIHPVYCRFCFLQNLVDFFWINKLYLENLTGRHAFFMCL